MTEMLRVKNWREHQHYKSKAGTPVWIKLYRKILTDYKFRGLPEADRFKLIGVWILASETEGLIPNDGRYVADCIGVRRVNLDLFVTAGFLETVYTESRETLVGIGDTTLVPEEKRREEKKDQGLSVVQDAQPSAESLTDHGLVAKVIAAQFGKETAA